MLQTLFTRDEVALAYDEIGHGSPPLVFIHGWAGNHTFFAPQVEFFGRSHRVVAVDLRGHGASDAPDQDYTMPAFTSDIAWQCAQLGINRPIVIGHSMGGVIALELAARFPDLVSAIVMIEAPVFIPQALINVLRPIAHALRRGDYLSVLGRAASTLFIATDDTARREWILAAMSMTPQHVLASTFENYLIDYDATAAARRCLVPVAYIGAHASMVDIRHFRAECPQLVTGQTIGSGHFSPLEVPDQINAMLARLLAVDVRLAGVA